MTRRGCDAAAMPRDTSAEAAAGAAAPQRRQMLGWAAPQQRQMAGGVGPWVARHWLGGPVGRIHGSWAALWETVGYEGNGIGLDQGLIHSHSNRWIDGLKCVE